MIKEKTCIAPFINLTIDPEHNVSPCPYLGGGAWKFPKNQTASDIWNSKNFESLRQSHLKNQQNPICQRCWDEEKIGKESARQRIIKDNQQNLDDISSSISNNSYRNGPKILTMKNGNICNLRCRTCGPKDSSVWIPEAKSYVEQFPQKINDTWFGGESFKKNWSSTQMDELLKFNKNLTRVEHYGGEPLLNPLVETHTQILVETGISKNVVLYFNTNGTCIPSDSLQKMFQHFKKVEMNLSIDGIYKKFEYIRHPAKWKDLLQTKEWLDQNSQIEWGIILTISNLNIFYVDQMLEWFSLWGKNNIFQNILTDPKYYSIQNLPQHVKSKISNKFHKNKHLENLIKFMNSSDNDETQWQNFLFWTKQSDKYRNENFQDTFKEFTAII